MKHPTGDRFKKIADELFGGNLSELARAMGMTPQSFNKYAQGEIMPGGVVLKRVISIGVNLNWLIAGIPPMLIRDISEAGVTHIKVVGEPEADYFKGINQEELNDAERHLLVEVKRFSDFLRDRPLNPQIKRLLLEQLIQSIDQAIEQRERDQS